MRPHCAPDFVVCVCIRFIFAFISFPLPQRLKARKDVELHPSSMIAGTPSGSNPSSPVPGHNPSSDALPPPSLPCWAAQAQGDLAKQEAELRRLQERHATETETVQRGVERAVLGARREERRLLERVEQDHRDTQQHLEQVQRENMAAARVSQSLLDQRLCKLALLQQRIQEVGQHSGLDYTGSNHNLLLGEVIEFLQPWEISVSLKKVHFKPSSQPNAVTFGDIRMQDETLCLHAGGCWPLGQLCARHTQEMQGQNTSLQGTGEAKGPQEQGWVSPTGRVVRKISLSTWCDPESEEEPTLSSPKIHHWPSTREQLGWESSHDDEAETASYELRGEEVFLTVPTILRNKDAESGERTRIMNYNGKHSPRNQRKPLTVGSRQDLSSSLERRKEPSKLSHCLSLDSQSGDKGNVDNSRQMRSGNKSLTSPRVTPGELAASKSCQDLTSRGRPHSGLSQSSDEHSLGTLGDSGRAPSPADSLDSSYTFIVSPSHDHSVNRSSLNYNCRLSKSAVDLTHKTHPLISGGTNEHVGVWRVKCSNFNSTSSSIVTSPALRGRQKVSDRGQAVSYPTYQRHNILQQKQFSVAGCKQSTVARSLSMSVIDGSSPEPRSGRRERGESALVELEEEAEYNPRGVHLIRQFGKQGSGRADLTLPSGIHCTPQGQLFIVDCGNARIQVCVVINVLLTLAN